MIELNVDFIIGLLLGLGLGLVLAEVFALLSNRVRYRRTKKRDAQPLLGVVLPKEKK